MSLLARTGIGANNLELNLSNDRLVPNGPSDTVSHMEFSPTADLLSVASWDKAVRIYEVNGSTQESQGRALYNHEAPVLDTAWFADGSKVISGGCDNAVRAYDLASGQPAQIGAHDQPVSGVACVDVGQPMVASCSWDKTVKYWDMRQEQPVATVQLPERAYSMDTQKKLLTVGCADRNICIFNLDNPGQIFRTSPCSLKQGLRVVACHSDGAGYAYAGVEARCGIAYVDPSRPASASFSFRCHRVKQPSSGKPSEYLYAVNDLCFHPVYNTLASCGADGTIQIWDKESKLRIRYSKDVGGIVTSMAFNHSGNLLAYSTGYDWSKGYEFNTPSNPLNIKIHAVKEMEVKPKNTPKKTNY